jgi:hypothetical protein
VTVHTTGQRTRAVTWFVGAYAVLSGLTVLAIATFASVAPSLVNPQAWVRGVIVAATSLLTVVFARRAAAGSARALLRLRITVVVILVAIGAVLFLVPLPGWMIAEQIACGVLLLATAVVIFQ